MSDHESLATRQPSLYNPAEDFSHLQEQALSWVTSVDTYVNADIDRAQREYEADEIESFSIEARKTARIVNFLSRKIESGDAFVIRLLSTMEKSAGLYPNPIEVRQLQYDDFEHVLKSFMDQPSEEL
jgi:hypothetical protein